MRLPTYACRLSAREPAAWASRRGAPPSRPSVETAATVSSRSSRRSRAAGAAIVPVLQEALARTKASRGLLVIAKLDRLARNVEFIAHLQNSGVDFAACDLPEANRFTIQILAAAAELQAQSISEDTKRALAIAKADSKVLGNPNTRNGLPPDVWRKGLLAARVARRDLRDQALQAIAHKIKALRAEGYSYRQLARALNDEGYITATGAAGDRRPFGSRRNESRSCGTAAIPRLYRARPIHIGRALRLALK